MDDDGLFRLRCPEGEGQHCFHQKHPSAGMPKAVQQVTVQEKKGPEPQLMVSDLEGVLGLVQNGRARDPQLGLPGGLARLSGSAVFDLDPDTGLPWERVVEAAVKLRERLESLGLTGFAKSTGGKGLHVVVPVEPSTPWEQTKQFCKQLADELVRAEPDKYVATMTKQRCKGKLFIDYFRNGSGATAVCAFSTRARPGAPVAVPLGWEELGRVRPAFTLRSLEQRLASLHQDPWQDFDAARAVILPQE